LQDNKLNSDVEKFINDEITNSKIWVFCGIMISVLLSQMLNLQAEMYKIMYIFKMKQVLDKMSFLFIAIIILEIFLTFFLVQGPGFFPWPFCLDAKNIPIAANISHLSNS